MIAECREYLIAKLKGAGIRTAVFTSMKKLKLTQESHLGAVLFSEETFTRDGSKRIIENNELKLKQRKVFERTLIFEVIIGEYLQENAEKLMEKFILELEEGIKVEGNFVAVEPESAEWVDEDDSILNAKVAVQLRIKFEAGLYVNTGFAKVKEADIVAVGMER